MKIVAAMIVKNEEACILTCLESLNKEGIEGIIIADTGSTDNTLAVIRQFADKCAPFVEIHTDYKWEDSFAKARNHVMSKVEDGAWVISIDADEELMPGSIVALRKLLMTLDPKVVSIGVTVRAKGSGHETIAPRVYKRCEEVFWQGAAHNYLSKRAQVSLPEFVIEYGYSPAHKADPDRTLRILSKAVAENPDKPREIYYLAREYWYRKLYKVALKYYDQYLELSSWAPEKADAYLQRARCLLNLDRKSDAKDSCVLAIRTQPTFKEAFEFMAATAETFAEKIQWLRYALSSSNEGVLFVRTKPVYNTSVIILTKNSDTLEKCVEATMRSTVCPTEIIVVNSGSDPKNIEGTREIFVPGDTTHIQQLKIGEDAARAEYVVAFCDDHFPQEGWLELAHFGFRQAFHDGFGVLCLNEGLNLRGSKACVTLTNKATIKHLLNGIWYDTAYHQYRVDVDLAIRANKMGRYMYCADAVVRHEHKGQPFNYPERFEHDSKIFDERWGKDGANINPIADKK